MRTSLLPNPDDLLRPGLRAEFSIVVETRTDVVTVPRSALQGDPAGRFVYVKDFDVPNAFVKTPVVVGKSNDRVVEIVSGLLPADEVVTQGAYSLAFVGGGGISLKDALDAAHGHDHAPDGSELKATDPTPAREPVPHAFVKTPVVLGRVCPRAMF
jgi:cobalt-zinc-cadmium efflux system membrane fusion protein